MKAIESLVFIGVHVKYGEIGPIIMSGVLGLLMAFIADFGWSCRRFRYRTEAFFSTDDFFSFTRNELARHEPAMFELLKKLWGESTTPD